MVLGFRGLGLEGLGSRGSGASRCWWFRDYVGFLGVLPYVDNGGSCWVWDAEFRHSGSDPGTSHSRRQLTTKS